MEAMGKTKPYKEQDENKQVVGEPALEYSTIREDVDYLPEEVLVGAIKYAQIAREKGRMISNKDIYGLLSKKLGWTARSSSFAKSSNRFSY